MSYPKSVVSSSSPRDSLYLFHILQACFMLEPLATYTRLLFPHGTHDTITTISSNDHCHIGIAITHILCLFNDLVVALVSHTVISFAVISSLLSELQIQNSELGKLALSSALISDILCTIATAIGTAVMITENSNVKDVIRNVLALICLAIFIPLVCRPTMLWIIKHTPEGRAVKDGYVYLIIVLLFILGWLSVKLNHEFVLGAFIFGIFCSRRTSTGICIG